VRASLGLMASVLFALLIAGGAQAHAVLVGANPPANSRIDAAPAEMRLFFNEPLEATFSSVAVVDAAERDYVASVQLDATERALVAAMNPMPDGLYKVRWQTLSQSDGHPRSGLYLLAINTTLPAAELTSDDGLAPLDVALRWVLYAGLAAGLGVPLFAWRTGWLGRGPLVASLATTAAALAALNLFIWTARSTGLSVPALAATRVGGLALWRIGALVVAAGGAYLWHQHHARRGPLLVAVACGAAILLTAMQSHAVSRIAIAADAIHLAGASIWLGGVAPFALDARRMEDARLAHVLRRFSPMAMESVAVVILTGIFAGNDRLPSPEYLGDGMYGRALLGKLLLIVPLVLLGALHRFVLLPRLGQRRAILHRTLLYETAGMAIVLVLASILAAMQPPLDEPQPHRIRFTEDDLRVTIEIDPWPVRAGYQQMLVTIDADHELDLRVYADLLGPDGITTIEAHDEPQGWHFGGALFDQAGTWQVTLRIEGEAHATHSITVEVAE
jgi:copper transport protein